MDAYTYWFVFGAILIAAELMTGTFYLLVIGAAAVIAGTLVYVANPGWPGAITLFSLLSLAGVFMVRRLKKPVTEAPVDDDSGNSVVLLHISPRDPKLWRVSYRGAEWDATLKGGTASAGDSAVIAGKSGNVLIIDLVS